MPVDCSHDLDPEYPYPGDVDVLGLSERNGELSIQFALPCPEYDRALELEADVRSVEESNPTLPVDANELYD